jgi:hypothetical protein
MPFGHLIRCAELTREKMREIPLGDRRSFHDDITFIIADLTNQGQPQKGDEKK